MIFDFKTCLVIALGLPLLAFLIMGYRDGLFDKYSEPAPDLRWMANVDLLPSPGTMGEKK